MNFFIFIQGETVHEKVPQNLRYARHSRHCLTGTVIWATTITKELTSLPDHHTTQDPTTPTNNGLSINSGPQWGHIKHGRAID